jgi:hypothetical protein
MNLDILKERVLQIYTGRTILLRITANAGDGKIQSYLKANAEVLKQDYTDSTVIMEVRLGKNQLAELQRFKSVQIEEIKE